MQLGGGWGVDTRKQVLMRITSGENMADIKQYHMTKERINGSNLMMIEIV